MHKFTCATFEHHWDLSLRDCSERREKETQKLATQKTLRKTHIVQQTKHQGQIISNSMLSVQLQEIGWDLSLMKISYNLTKRTTKTEKFENSNMFIINFKTIRDKLTVSGNIIQSMLN